MLQDSSTTRFPIEALVGFAQEELSQRLASIILLAETACEDLPCPLNELQRRALLTAALQVMDGLGEELEAAYAAIGALSSPHGFSVKV